MTEELIVITQKQRSPKEMELLKYAQELLKTVEGEGGYSNTKIFILINKIIKLVGPSFGNVPPDLRKALGVTYVTAAAETDIGAKSSYTRSALSLARAAVKIANGPKSQIDSIDNYIYKMEKEIAIVEEMGEEATFGTLWATTNRALDYVSMLAFSGYGELNSKGFSFSKKEDSGKEALK
jgi:hypothetical protein